MHKNRLCPSCGRPLEECTDKATERRWQPHVLTCYATKARSEYYDDHDDLGPEALVTFSLLPEGVEPVDPLASDKVFDPARAARDRAELDARHPDRH